MKHTLLIALLLIGGCAMLEHEDANGNMTRYFRCGDQSIQGGSITLPDGSVLNFDSQDAKLPVVKITTEGITIGKAVE